MHNKFSTFVAMVHFLGCPINSIDFFAEKQALLVVMSVCPSIHLSVHNECQALIRPNQTKPDQPKPDQTRSNQLKPDQTGPNKAAFLWISSFHLKAEQLTITSQCLFFHKEANKLNSHIYGPSPTSQPDNIVSDTNNSLLSLLLTPPHLWMSFLLRRGSLVRLWYH